MLPVICGVDAKAKAKAAAEISPAVDFDTWLLKPRTVVITKEYLDGADCMLKTSVKGTPLFHFCRFRLLHPPWTVPETAKNTCLDRNQLDLLCIPRDIRALIGTTTLGGYGFRIIHRIKDSSVMV